MLVRKAGELRWRLPRVAAYADEDAIQTIIEQSPDLLPGATGTRMAVAREVAMDAGYVDVVAVDEDGAITLVECKLKANPEIRRHVVGQVFAYAAALWGATYETFDLAFAARAGAPLARRVAELAESDWDEEAFRASVSANLQAGRFRLIIAVDEITDELAKIVRYLNEHTSSELQILALELRYVADDGIEILLPTVYGTESAQDKATTPSTRRWDEVSFFASLASCCSSAGLRVARHLYDSAAARGAVFSWGAGPLPSVTARLPVAGKHASVFSLYEWPEGKGTLAINFEYLVERLPDTTLSAVAERLRRIPGVAEHYQGLEQAAFRKRPSLPLDQIGAQPEAMQEIWHALESIFDPLAEQPALGTADAAMTDDATAEA